MALTVLDKNEDELAEQLVGFFQQFFEVFSELKGKHFYLTGESVGRRFVTWHSLTSLRFIVRGNIHTLCVR